MNKAGHRAGAFGVIGATLAVQYCFKINAGVEGLILFPAIYVGSFLPDMDADYSYFRSKLPGVSNAYTYIQKKFQNNPDMHMVLKHRGLLFHSVWTLILLAVPALVLLILPQIGLSGFNLNKLGYCGFIGLVIGCFGHHLLDMTTPAGLPQYLYGIPTRKRKW